MFYMPDVLCLDASRQFGICCGMTRDLVLAIIVAFGGIAPMSRMLRHKHHTTVLGWSKRGSIPHWRHREILAAADFYRVELPPEALEAMT